MKRSNAYKRQNNCRINKNITPYNSFINNSKKNITTDLMNDTNNNKDISRPIKKKIIIKPIDNDIHLINKILNNPNSDYKSRIIPIGINNMKEESNFITELIKNLIFNDNNKQEDDNDETSNYTEKKYDLSKKYIELDPIKCLKDLITLGKSYNKDVEHNYPIDLERLYLIVEPLEQLEKVIGMDKVKKSIINQVIYFLLNLEPNKDMLHTIIQGPPGVGKTMLGEILGKIYYNMNIIKRNKKNKEFKFKIVKRQDLIGQYLGQTAMKTQQVIDECIGGVMFIDEAYSLGNEEKKDIYSKEALDTLNQNLSEKSGQFVCIIAGYPDELEKCFFSVNEGLKRRFTFKYTIDKYTAKELSEILLKKINDSKWTCNENLNINSLSKFIGQNYNEYPNFAGDMETLLFHVKIAHGYRIFGKHPNMRKNISLDDIIEGHKLFINARENGKKNNALLNMYV